jgi:peptidoglycan hydrolase-like protein with peptidoglycan-binding domain
MAQCITTSWRGSSASAPAVKVCAHSVPRLNNLAKAVGNDILVKALPGCGSYQTTTAASAGTHAGGGAIDLNLNGLTYAQRRLVEAKGRQHYGLFFYRWAITGLWTNHGHGLDSTCPNLSKTAVAQFPLFFKGYDALVGNNPDTGDRTYVSQIKADFNQRLVGAVVDVVTGVGQAVSNAARVQALQKAVRQTVDGLWGEQTDIDLRNTRATAQQGRAYFDRWSKSQKQRMQKSWGVTQDGVWGAQTQRGMLTAVKAIQAGLGVAADGDWGSVTDARYLTLRKACYRPPVPAAPKPKPINYNYPYQVAKGWYPYPGKIGASYYGPSKAGTAWYSGKASGGTKTGASDSGGLKVSLIQGHINRIRRVAGLQPTGHYDDACVRAVKAWQKAHGLTADGICGPTTWAAMARSRGQGK